MNVDAIGLIRQVSSCGVVLRAEGQRIRFSPANCLPSDLAWKIGGSKHAVINALGTLHGTVLTILTPICDPKEREELEYHFEECAAVREFEQGNDRDLAECIAFTSFGEELERRYAKALARTGGPVHLPTANQSDDLAKSCLPTSKTLR